MGLIGTFAIQNNHIAIRIFVTGGTFDKEYNEITGQLFLKEKEYRIKCYL
jgi:hypothetical protein